MSVSTSTRKQTYAGGQNSLSFSFKTLVDHPEYVKALKTLISTGVNTDLSYSSDYTVSLLSDGVGGTVTMTPSLSTLYNVTVYRETDDKQESDYEDYSQFPADTLENDLDRRTLVSQESSEESGRTLKLAISSSLSDVSVPEPVADKFLGWNSAGTGIENKSVVSIGTIVIDTDGTLAANSDAKIATQKATRTYVTTSIASVTYSTALLIGCLSFLMDGGGDVISTGVKGDLEVPYNCNIDRATLLADQSGSIVIDVWKDTYANYPPTIADTITASAKPTLATAVKSQDATLTGWTKAVASGSTLRINVDSCSTITRCLLSLKVTRT
jgi:hypothetical protein